MKLRCDPYRAMKLLHEATTADLIGNERKVVIAVLNKAINEWDDCLSELIAARDALVAEERN